VVFADRTLEGRAIGLISLGIAHALLLVWGSDSTAPDSAARQLMAVLVGNALGVVALLWIGFDQRFDRTPVWFIFGAALLLRVIATQASPLLEDDHYRYLWDGFRTATALDPYRLPPSAFFGDEQLSQRWQDILSGINNPDITTIYGPVLQGFFAFAYWLSPGQLGAIQGLLLVLDLAVLGLLAQQGVSRRSLLIYAVHPLLLREAMASAHPDGLLALFLMLALIAWQRRRPFSVGSLLALAIATKVAALVVVPLLLFKPLAQRYSWDWAARLVLSCGLVLALLYLPFWLSGGSDAPALATFGSQWRFNPLMFRVLELWFLPYGARLAGALLIVLGVGLLSWHWFRTQARDRRYAASAPSAPLSVPPLAAPLVLLLLLAPVVNPWYWMWALALSLRCGHHWVAAAGAVSALSYWNSTVLTEASWLLPSELFTPYSVAMPIALLQLTAFGASWLVIRWVQRVRAEVSVMPVFQ
jgi:alpha-1,6-mannosyltransferase